MVRDIYSGLSPQENEMSSTVMICSLTCSVCEMAEICLFQPRRGCNDHAKMKTLHEATFVALPVQQSLQVVARSSYGMAISFVHYFCVRPNSWMKVVFQGCLEAVRGIVFSTKDGIARVDAISVSKEIRASVQLCPSEILCFRNRKTLKRSLPAFTNWTPYYFHLLHLEFKAT